MIIYARVSSPEHRENLERLVHYCTARGYQVHQVVKEIGSGVNDSRPKLLAALKDPHASRIVVEHKDRLTRFGFRYLQTLLAVQHRTVEVVNQAEQQHRRPALGSHEHHLQLLRQALWTTSGQTEDASPAYPDQRGGTNGCSSLNSTSFVKMIRAIPSSMPLPFASKNLYNQAMYQIRQALPP